MSAPYREPSAPSDEGPTLGYDYAKAIRDGDKPRVIVKGLAFAVGVPIGCIAIYAFLLQITLVHFLELSGAVLGVFVALMGPVVVIALRRDKDQAAVEGLLQGLDKRDRH